MFGERRARRKRMLDAVGVARECRERVAHTITGIPNPTTVWAGEPATQTRRMASPGQPARAKPGAKAKPVSKRVEGPHTARYRHNQ